MTQSLRLAVSRVALTLATLLLATPAFGADAVPAPVTVSDCRGGIASIELVEMANYAVTFRNTATATADEIRFAIPYGRRKTATFTVRGTFSPDIDIRRALQKSVGVGLYGYSSTNNTCRVEFVHFTDGSSWTPAAANTQAPS